MRFLRRVSADESGGVLVEVTVMLTIVLVFVLGSVDFLMAMYQWNAATKAVQQGARVAAVSDPVSIDLQAYTGIGGAVYPGDPMPYFKRICDGAAATCSGGTFSAAALDTIVYGRGSAACGDSTSIYMSGMCDLFARITPANVNITYEQVGLGYAGRPGGPIPSIKVTLQNLPFQFFFLGGLMNFANIQIAPVVTITAEDMRSGAPLN